MFFSKLTGCWAPDNGVSFFFRSLVNISSCPPFFFFKGRGLRRRSSFQADELANLFISSFAKPTRWGLDRVFSAGDGQRSETPSLVTMSLHIGFFAVLPQPFVMYSCLNSRFRVQFDEIDFDDLCAMTPPPGDSLACFPFAL